MRTGMGGDPSPLTGRVAPYRPRAPAMCAGRDSWSGIGTRPGPPGPPAGPAGPGPPGPLGPPPPAPPEPDPGPEPEPNPALEPAPATAPAPAPSPPRRPDEPCGYDDGGIRWRERRALRQWRAHHTRRNRPAPMDSTRPTPEMAVERTSNVDVSSTIEPSRLETVTSMVNAPDVRTRTGTSSRVVPGASVGF